MHNGTLYYSFYSDVTSLWRSFRWERSEEWLCQQLILVGIQKLRFFEIPVKKNTKNHKWSTKSSSSSTDLKTASLSVPPCCSPRNSIGCRFCNWLKFHHHVVNSWSKNIGKSLSSFVESVLTRANSFIYQIFTNLSS